MGFFGRWWKNTQIQSLTKHMHTLLLRIEERPAGHIYKFAQCVRKLELIHILNLALCFIVRHLFCYSHQGDKRQQSHTLSCSPLLVCLCACSCLADQWMGCSTGHKAPQIKERKQKGIGITSFRWPSTETKIKKKKKKGRGSKEKKTLKG